MSDHKEKWRVRRKMEERKLFKPDATPPRKNLKVWEGPYTRDESRAGIAWDESDEDSRL
jgi:hypothetical protein